MKWIKLLSIAALWSCAAFIGAQTLYDASGGHVIGKISGNRIYDASGGHTIAQIQGERIYDGSGGRMLNYLKSNGQVTDASGGYSVGYIKSNGQVMDASGGHTLGYVENGNVYDKSHGRKIGSYSGGNTQLVAYFYFFFPDKNKTPAAKKKPAKLIQETPLYDRSYSRIGTLYDDNKMVTLAKREILIKPTDKGETVYVEGHVFAYIGKDKQTIYRNDGKTLFGYIDAKGNVYDENKKQYGLVRDDGKVYGTSKLDMLFGNAATVTATNRRAIGLFYFVYYYNVLYEYYTKLDAKKADSEKKD